MSISRPIPIECFDPLMAFTLGALSSGVSRIAACEEVFGEPDVGSILEGLRTLGVETIYRPQRGGGWRYELFGRGLGGLSQPAGPIHATERSGPILATLLAIHPIATVLTGAVLPDRLIATLQRAGATVRQARGSAMVWIEGTARVITPSGPVETPPELLPAMLPLALAAAGRTDLACPDVARLMPLLRAFGAEVAAADAAADRNRLSVIGEAELNAADIAIGF